MREKPQNKAIKKLYSALTLRKEIEFLRKKAADSEDASLRRRINQITAKAIVEEIKVLEFINRLPDGFTRYIFELKFLEGYSYRDIAQKIGGNNTEDGIRKTVKRNVDKYLK